MSSPRKLAVFASACRIEVNRKIYRLMAADGWEVHIFVPSRHLAPFEPPADGLPVTQLDKKGARTRFYYYREAAAHLDRFQPDQVLLDLEPDSLLACQIGFWCARNRRVFHVQCCENQGIWETMESLPFPQRALRYIVRRLFLICTTRCITHTFSISHAGTRLLESFGFKGRVTRIPLGVDTSAFCPDPAARASLRKSWDIGPDTPVVAYIGRLVPAKGVHLLLEALITLPHLDWKLALDDFQSEGSSYPDRIKALLAHEVFRSRLITIHASHADIPRYMNAVDILAVPSIPFEGFLEQYGRVVPEALACGTEILTSDSGALPEIGLGATTVFPAGSVPALTEALAKAITTPNAERAKSAESRRSAALLHLSLHRQWETMKPVLESPTLFPSRPH